MDFDVFARILTDTNFPNNYQVRRVYDACPGSVRQLSVFQNSSNVWAPRASKDPSFLCEGKPFITTLAITFRRCFVLFLEIDSPGEFNNPSAGITVDKDEGGILELPTTPRLYGNNAMEQGLAFYCMDKYSPQIPIAGDIPIDG